MIMQQRVTTLYTQLFHHAPDLGKKDDATEYAILEVALRQVVEECNHVAEQHAVDPKVPGVTDSGMLPTNCLCH